MIEIKTLGDTKIQINGTMEHFAEAMLSAFSGISVEDIRSGKINDRQFEQVLKAQRLLADLEVWIRPIGSKDPGAKMFRTLGSLQ